MTSAAVIMVAVFSIFATLSLIELKMIGVGLAAAVLIDATVVRGILLPGGAGAARRAELVPAALAGLAARRTCGRSSGPALAAARLRCRLTCRTLGDSQKPRNDRDHG